MVGILGEKPVLIVTVLITYVILLRGHQQDIANVISTVLFLKQALNLSGSEALLPENLYFVQFFFGSGKYVTKYLCVVN
jgi:hypothetical protein